ncbi:Protein of unknown function (DUF2892) [Maribacter vaceletii]|uniref:Inner membrane protein YgaP-like transmembrane domain-containing protein n=1 Tax=Maribacter vaceletii TaxID=1206816 RepID=A0A495EBN1_9FLAO|nr:DUF2892 domain-containing protein [Maribacter vaceletii]RKR14285.1 Protein of unknown function (DUF2892) [Maribacter vaceletii]
MKKNMNGVDRIIRFIIAAIVLALYYTNVIEGTLAYVLMALSVIFVVTGFVSFCPLYKILGISTCKINSKK